MGSSPHTRGARAPCRRCRRCPGDHPRIRGEHRLRRDIEARLLRIIPAYAGSTILSASRHASSRGSSPHTRGARSSAPFSPGSARDHPRIRGEHSSPAPCRRRCRVDHPRIRGEHLAGAGAAQDEDGIIPAYAGSTLALAACSAVLAGSSPHTRGARPVPPRMGFQVWIIPAYAGSTPLSW